MFETNYIDVNQQDTFVYVRLSDNCSSQMSTHRTNDNWIRLQYREINRYQWITLHVFKGSLLT
jgi:Fe-S cluster biogenesis protein NfuA